MSIILFFPYFIYVRARFFQVKYEGTKKIDENDNPAGYPVFKKPDTGYPAG